MMSSFAFFPAAIVSDSSRMFLSGGEWLPDAVPNAAIYDTATPEGKELRVSTNVAAAAASCLSGICERMAVGCYGAGHYVWEDTPPGADTFRSMYVYEFGGSPLRDPSGRVIDSYRFPGHGALGGVRDMLRQVANDGEWGGRFWGSSHLRGHDVPTFPWTGAAPYDLYTVAEWSMVWPQFCATTNDGVWRTSSAIRHGAARRIVDAYRFGAFESRRMGELGDAVHTNALADTCLRILEERLGADAVQFADDTCRLSYYRLGALETALAAMDTTYDVVAHDAEEPNDFEMRHDSYHHARGYEYVDSLELPTDFNRLTVSLASVSPTWQPYEQWSTSTNTAGYKTSSHPAFVCGGDTPTGHRVYRGSRPVYVTYEQIEGYYTPANTTYVFLEVRNGGIGMHVMQHGEITVSTNVPINEASWTVSMSAGVTRHIAVDYTDRLLDERPNRLTYPMPWAWARGMVRAHPTALEYRVSVSGRLPETDTGGYCFGWLDEDRLGTNAVQEAEIRSVPVGEYATTNAYMQAMRTQRMRHRNEVSDMMLGMLGCTLADRDALIPIPAGVCDAMRDGMPGAGQTGITYRVDAVAIIGERVGDLLIVNAAPNTSEYGEWFPLGPGERVKIGELQFSVIDRTDVEVGLKGRPQCYAWGDGHFAKRIRWRFQNLHEEETQK